MNQEKLFKIVDLLLSNDKESVFLGLCWLNKYFEDEDIELLNEVLFNRALNASDELSNKFENTIIKDFKSKKEIDKLSALYICAGIDRICKNFKSYKNIFAPDLLTNSIYDEIDKLNDGNFCPDLIDSNYKAIIDYWKLEIN